MEEQIFKAKRHYISSSQLLNSSPETIFPLLCPAREYDWIETWKGITIYSVTGFAEMDCVFTTQLPGGKKDTWIVDEYDVNKRIQFIRFTDERVIRYCITLIDNHNHTTTAKWEQTITSLSDEGNRYIDNFSDNEFKSLILDLEKKLNYYLGTGQMLKAY